jgi:hypothetical protein
MGGFQADEERAEFSDLQPIWAWMDATRPLRPFGVSRLFARLSLVSKTPTPVTFYAPHLLRCHPALAGTIGDAHGKELS